MLWSEDKYSSLWCGFSLIKPKSGWPPVWFSLCQACGMPTRVGETACRSDHEHQILAKRWLVRLACRYVTPTKILQILPAMVFSLHRIPSVLATCHSSSHTVCQQLFLQWRWQQLWCPEGHWRCCLAPSQSLVQVSQLWDPTWRTTPETHRGNKSPYRPQSSHPNLDVCLIILTRMIITICIILDTLWASL